MHTPCVVSSDIAARVMVLRAFDRATWTLRFHTDIRAPKVKAVRADPRMAVLFYDKGAKIQIRASGTGLIEAEGPVADAAWAAGVGAASRRTSSRSVAATMCSALGRRAALSAAFSVCAACR